MNETPLTVQDAVAGIAARLGGAAGAVARTPASGAGTGHGNLPEAHDPLRAVRNGRSGT